MARILAVTNRKGGTGKTATAVNVAAELAAQGQRVLLVDLDTQGHSGVGLGFRGERDSPTVHGWLAGRHALSAAIWPTPWPGLSLVPADPLFEHGSSAADEGRLWRALQDEALLARFDCVVIDTPPSLDTLLLNALVAADRVLVPFVPHHLSGEGVKQLARVLFKVSSQGRNDRLRLLGFLPVMLDLRVGLHRQVHHSLGQQFGQERVLPGIRNDIRLAEAFGHGCPVRVHAPDSRAAQDYARATEALWRRWA